MKDYLMPKPYLYRVKIFKGLFIIIILYFTWYKMALTNADMGGEWYTRCHKALCKIEKKS